ncbi:R3H and coiled-coil domain-containing protein 1 isoform X2 [Dermacentor silvarum]|nr:R3H and coiled-coil domain-containing protein 1 isoform X1 [Dermacentor silvarum]XP_049522581.1 R3H and coiled-coil domain-containing protein 1 isoform X2 [Dermacentor silvarum]
MERTKFQNGDDRDEVFVQTVCKEITNFVQGDVHNSVLIFPVLPKRERFLTHKVVEEKFEDLCSFSLGEGVCRRTAVCLKSRLIFAFENGYCLDEAARKVALRLCREKGLPVDFLSHSIKRPLPSSREMQAPRPTRQRQRRPDIQLYVPRGRKAEALKTDARDAPAQEARVPSQHLPESEAPVPTTDAADPQCRENTGAHHEDASTEHNRKASAHLIEATNVCAQAWVPSQHLPESQAPLATTDAADPQLMEDTETHHEDASTEHNRNASSHFIETANVCAQARVLSQHLAVSQAPLPTTDAADPLCREDTGAHHEDASSEHYRKASAHLSEVTNVCGMGGDVECTGLEDSNCDVLSTSGNSENGEAVIQVCLSLSQENENDYFKKTEDEGSQEVNSLQEFSSVVTDCAGMQKYRSLLESQGGVGIVVGNSVVRTSEQTEHAAHEEPPLTNHLEMAHSYGEHVDTAGDSTEASIEENHKDAEDSWDALFDETGECVAPEVLKNITKALGDIKVHQAELDYTKFEPRIPDLSEAEYGHVLEIYDFPAEFETKDLVTALSSCRDQFNIKWVDDTHALAIFSTPFAATEALGLQNSLMKMRHVSEASKQSKLKIKHCSEFLMPYKPRPQTSASVARRLVSGALGMRVNVDAAQRRKELQMLKEAKGKKKTAAKQRTDVWNGDVS